MSQPANITPQESLHISEKFFEKQKGMSMPTCPEICPTCGEPCEIAPDNHNEWVEKYGHTKGKLTRGHYHWQGNKLHEWVTWPKDGVQ